MFKTIDNEAKAYAVGLAAAGTDFLAVPQQSGLVLAQLSEALDLGTETELNHDGSMYRLPLDPQSRNSLMSHLGDQHGEVTRLPPIEDSLIPHLIRGMFDRAGEIFWDKELILGSTKYHPAARLPVPQSIIPDIEAVYPASKRRGDTLLWEKDRALDFLGLLYEGTHLRSKPKYMQYRHCATYFESNGLDVIWWRKEDSRAFAPYKERPSDSGYDLTLIDKVKEVGNVGFYTTGINIEPPYGWYFDLVPRSSITKSGYILANSTGIIDRSYRGPVIAALAKIDPNAPDLILPNRIVQIVPRPAVHFETREVSTLSDTNRGSGKFGSTG